MITFGLGPTIQTPTARSCAFNCAFCNYPARTGRLSLASVDTIEKDLDSLRALGDFKSVVFIDATFNVPLDRFKRIYRRMIQKQYGFHWFSYFRCSNSDDDAIDLMARSGCWGLLFLGIESGSPSILRNMNKAATVDKYERGIERLRRHGILIFASFIVRVSRRDGPDGRRDAGLHRAHRADYYRAQLWYDEPGTPIEHQRAVRDPWTGLRLGARDDGEPRGHGSRRPHLPERARVDLAPAVVVRFLDHSVSPIAA